ncbi:hypothetical protein GUJ93_ZPchr0010g7729 [Zizania palustris]|uniref:Uncharacterized protein n=1 Tax=Zizania palustris TaxID=103762 RepID=A0A8J5WB00_ZIZPA|nr:hypothetical protein GUJ93_ZPchr0010g7729 [Zizania palustris]
MPSCNKCSSLLCVCLSDFFTPNSDSKFSKVSILKNACSKHSARARARARCSTDSRNAERREAAAASVDVAEVEPLHPRGRGRQRPRHAAGERRVLPRDAPDERWCSRPPRALPSVDSPYLRAKQAQVIEKDPNKAVPLFWAAINSGDRIESALKDMATVLKQANRAEEAIEAIRSFRDRCPSEAQESLDNILLDLYKKCGRTKEQIEMLTIKLRIVDEELASGRWKTKLSKFHGRVLYLSLRDEKARLLGNLAWAHMQSENYDEAEMLYRQALAIEADYNKECNLAICLIKMGKVAEAKYLLQAIPENCSDESHVRSFVRATEMLRELESPTLPSPITQMKYKESLLWLATDVEKLEHLHPLILSTP